MKITVNYISNVFLAFIFALLPYTALIKMFIKNNRKIIENLFYKGNETKQDFISL